MSNRDKMNESQNKVRKFLENDGAIVDFIHHTRFKLDLWGLWDGQCLFEKIKTQYYLQVKSNATPPIQKSLDWCAKYGQNAILANVLDKRNKVGKKLLPKGVLSGAIFKYIYGNETVKAAQVIKENTWEDEHDAANWRTVLKQLNT